MITINSNLVKINPVLLHNERKKKFQLNMNFLHPNVIGATHLAIKLPFMNKQLNPNGSQSRNIMRLDHQLLL